MPYLAERLSPGTQSHKGPTDVGKIRIGVGLI